MNLFEQYIEKLAVADCRAKVDEAPKGYRHPLGFWKEAALNLAFYGGDHFQRGAGWVGPGPSLGEDGYREFMDKLRGAFISQNAIKKGLDREVTGVIGNEPAWGAKLLRADTDEAEMTDAEKSAQAEHDALFTPYWNERGLHGVLKEFLETMLLVGRAHLRIFIPEDELDDQGAVPDAALSECLRRLWVECPPSQSARVFRHGASMRSLGVFLSKREVDVSNRQKRAATSLQTIAEVCYVDRDGKTHLKVIGAPKARIKAPADLVDAGEDALNPDEAASLNLVGNLWIYEAELPPLITEQIRSLQKLLNLARTVERRNLADNGWLEEFLLNAQLPGVWEVDKDGKKTGRFTPDPIKRGPNQVRVMTGVEYEVEKGKKSIATPSVYHRDPIDPTGSIAVADDAERAILKEMSQGHVALNDQQASSGEDRKQSRTDYEDSLDPLLAIMNGAGRWLLTTLRLIAVAHSKEADPFADFDVHFACRKNAGPRTGSERREDREQAKAGYLSREGVMERDGIDDVDAESARVTAEPGAMLDREIKRANLMAAFALAFDVETAAALAGYDQEFVAKITGGANSQPAPKPRKPRSNSAIT